MKKILFQISILAILFLTACKEQPIDISQMAPPTDRKILIEEFTGANCAACPKGANVIESLQEEFGSQVVAVSIHTTVSGALGNPIAGSAYDLRTQDGDDLAALFGGLSGIPAAVFNRTKFENESKMAVLAPDSWASLALSELNKEPIVDLTTDLQYDQDTRELIITIEATPRVDQSGDFRVGVMITESKIVDKQNNEGVVEDDYESNHILRELISSVDGDALASTFSLNATITKTYTYQIPPEENGLWRAEYCNIVTFVSEVNAGDGTIQVLQADEEHLGE